MSPEELRLFVAANDSFGFEMRVCAALKGPIVRDLQHGATYSDPVTGYNRQFDFRFTVREDRRCLLFALECKNIDPELPIVVCGRQRPEREAFLEIIVSRTYGVGPRSVIKRQTNTMIYPENGFVGKSVLKPDRNGKTKSRSNDGEIHDGWSQAIASSHDLIHVASKNGSGLCTIIVPTMVVPDGSLWRVSYDENGNTQSAPEPVNACEFFVGHRYQIEPEKRHEPVVLSHLHFLTLTGLKELLASLEHSRIDWAQWIPDEVLAAYPP